MTTISTAITTGYSMYYIANFNLRNLIYQLVQDWVRFLRPKPKCQAFVTWNLGVRKPGRRSSSTLFFVTSCLVCLTLCLDATP